MPLKGLGFCVCAAELCSPPEILIKFLKLQTVNYQSLTYMDVCVEPVLLLLYADIFFFFKMLGRVKW